MKKILAAALVAASFAAHAQTFTLTGEAEYLPSWWDQQENPDAAPAVVAWAGSIDVPALSTQSDGTFDALAWTMTSNVWNAGGISGYATVLNGAIVSFAAGDGDTGLAWPGGMRVDLDAPNPIGGGWVGSADLTAFSIDVVHGVSAVPEPAPWALLLLAAPLVMLRKRRLA